MTVLQELLEEDTWTLRLVCRLHSRHHPPPNLVHRCVESRRCGAAGDDDLQQLPSHRTPLEMLHLSCHQHCPQVAPWHGHPTQVLRHGRPGPTLTLRQGTSHWARPLSPALRRTCRRSDPTRLWCWAAWRAELAWAEGRGHCHAGRASAAPPVPPYAVCGRGGTG